MSGSPSVVQPDLRALRLGISDTFSLDELKVACFDLGIDYDDVPGATREVKVVELIGYARRRGMLQQLVAYVSNARPNLTLQRAAQAVAASPVTAEERARHRRALRDDRRDIYMVHTLQPLADRAGWYDILIYLLAHHEARLSAVSYAEFFLGRAWNNRIFRADNQGDFLGISVSAYGPFLCTCRVVFDDQHETMLERYIDFEMGQPLARAAARGRAAPQETA